MSHRPINLDEKIAIALSLSVIGGIFLWVTNRPHQFFSGDIFTSPSPSPAPVVTPLPSPEATVTPSPVVVPEKPVAEEPVAVVPSTIPPKTVIIPPQLTPEPAPSPTVTPEAVTPAVTEPAPSPTVTPEAVTPTPSPEPEPEASPQTEATPVEPGFADVPSNYWAYPFISVLEEQKILEVIAADQQFQPNQPLTRAEYALLVNRAFKLTELREAIAFGDIPGDFPSKNAIDQAVKSRFLSGYPQQLFEPNRPISKLEVLLSLVSGLGLKTASDSAAILAFYQDKDQIPEYAYQAITAATEAGLVVNYPNLKQLKPNQPVTRAEVATMIYQALLNQGDLIDHNLVSQYVVRLP